MDTALENADEEVVSVSGAVLWVSKNVARANYATSEASLTSCTSDVLSSPFGLAITSSQALTSALKVIFFKNTSSAFSQ